MSFLMSLIPPSIQCLILQNQYERHMISYTLYRRNPNFIQILSKRLSFNFFLPEYKIIREGSDEKLNTMYITGVGRCFVYQKF